MNNKIRALDRCCRGCCRGLAVRWPRHSGPAARFPSGSGHSPDKRRRGSAVLASTTRAAIQAPGHLLLMRNTSAGCGARPRGALQPLTQFHQRVGQGLKSSPCGGCQPCFREGESTGFPLLFASLRPRSMPWPSAGLATSRRCLARLFTPDRRPRPASRPITASCHQQLHQAEASLRGLSARAWPCRTLSHVPSSRSEVQPLTQGHGAAACEQAGDVQAHWGSMR